jgi:HEAT repeat protein
MNKDELIEQIKSNDAVDRYRAMFKVRDLYDDSLLKLLIPCLEDESEKISCFAIEIMGEYKNSDVYDYLMRMLNDPREQVRSSAIWALAQYKKPDFLNQLFYIINNEIGRVQYSAIHSLGYFNDYKAMDKLLEFLEIDEYSDCAESALREAIAKVKNDNHYLITQLKKRLDCNNPELIRKIVYLLSETENDKVENIFNPIFSKNEKIVDGNVVSFYTDYDSELTEKRMRELLTHENFLVQANALTVLSNIIIDESFVDLVTTFLKEDHTELCVSALNALNGCYKKNQKFKIMNLAKSLNIEVKAAAIQTLGSIEDDTIISIFLEALNDKNINVKKAAVQALSQQHTMEAADALINALYDKEINQYAAKYIGNLRGDDIEEKLLGLLNVNDWQVRASAIVALEAIGVSEKAAPYIFELFGDKNDEVRLVAAHVMINAKHPWAAQRYTYLLDDENELVRNMAVEGLWGVKESSAVIKLLDLLYDKKMDTQLVIESLVSTGQPEAIDAVVDFMEISDTYLKEKILIELWESEYPRFIEAVEVIKNNPEEDLDIRLRATVLLEQYR